MTTDDGTAAFRGAMTAGSDTGERPGSAPDIFADEGTRPDFGDLPGGQVQSPDEHLREAVQQGERGRRTAGEPDERVPEWRRREIEADRARDRAERETERQELARYREQERQRREQDERQQRPGFFDDPDAYLSRIEQGFTTRLEQAQQQQREQQFREMIEDAVDGDEAFQGTLDRFKAAAARDPALVQGLNGRSPARALRFVKEWGKQEERRSLSDDDFAAFKAWQASRQGTSAQPAVSAEAAPRQVIEGPVRQERPALRSIPSVNRATASPGDAEEIEDPVAAFRSASQPRR